MIFKTAFEKKDEGKLLIKFVLDNGEEKWGVFVDSEQFKTKARKVYDYASQNFKDGDEIDVIYKHENGQYLVERVSKKGAVAPPAAQTASTTGFACEACGKELKDGKYKKCYTCNQSPNTAPVSTPGKPTCVDCGKELKDAKYEKCYTCNQKNPSKKNGGKKGYGDRSPSVNESIKRQAIGNMTSRTLIALQGQVSPNTVVELAKTIYKAYQEMVG